MSATSTKATITISLTDLENLIRRVVHEVVREVVREELARLPHGPEASILDDWSHEGPDDLAGDEALLAEALVMSQQYRESKEGWKNWEEFKTELKKETESADALPD